MEKLRSIDTFGQLSGFDKYAALQEACEELERELYTCKNTGALKKDISLFSAALNSGSEQLPPYALEKFAKQLQALLKGLEAINRNSSVTRFKFKRKPTTLVPIGTASVGATPSNVVKPSTSLEPVQDQNIVVTHAAASYENLVRCTITCNAQNRQCATEFAESGSSALHLRSLNSCIVNLYGVPFDRGSIHIENAVDSLVLIRIQKEANIQVRLFGLKSCKLYIVHESMRRQAVVLENCENCCFHISMKEGIDIQDFSNISKCLTDEARHLRFEGFDIDGNDAAALSK
ncbi:LAQU0S08e02784g1_1 [Lachancea quebecensis]|uniref:LAQU0S08e02784g1_1 n=1 Tax=Lachancea quebecensis TaxID=1654605 RepID=A0A0P1KTA7_9SACH|nr:LAQU0S08e02784g1_1 [Lachancea quebecensis]